MTNQFEPLSMTEMPPPCPECERPHRFDRPCPTDMSDTRLTGDPYWLNIVEAYSRGADCRRRQAGAIIVVDKRLVAGGYNGAAAGQPGCLAGFCPRGLLTYSDIEAHASYESGPGTCIAIHAEANALLFSDRSTIKGGTMYLHPGSPCPGCRKLLSNSGLARVVWPDGEYLL